MDRVEGQEARNATGLLRYAVAASTVALVATAWTRSQGLGLLYADTRSHLTIARRLVDGPNRGLVQLGTVWLPLQHLLLAPFATLGPAWTSDWAGAIVGALCMGIEVAALFHITSVLNRGAKIAGLLASILYVTNPTILFLHTSSFTEPVLYASVLVATSGLVHWCSREKAFSGGEMALYCGAPAALAVLSRYDGWAFAAVWTACVAVLAWRRWGSGRYAARMTACFAAPPATAAIWWMWFNWQHWGDPLEFQRGRYSAQAQQDLLARRGELPDQGNLLGSAETFARAAWGAVGWITLVAALVGAVVVVVRIRGHRETDPVPARVAAFVGVLTLLPAAFYVWSLFSGQVALRLGGDPSGSTFNLRYGAAVIPGLAVLAGTALGTLGASMAWRRAAAVGLALCPFVALAVIPGWRDVGVVRESLEQRAGGEDQWAAAEWLEDRDGGGTLLIDDSVNPMLPVIGADLDEVVAPFSEAWRTTLRDPSDVTYIFVDRDNPDDEVARAIARDDGFLDGFDLATQHGSVAVYQASDGGEP